jgi:ribosome-binding protein aMBF1 (putative translation factor)
MTARAGSGHDAQSPQAGAGESEANVEKLSRLQFAAERMELVRAFASRLAEHRLAAGLSPSELAGRCRIAPDMITRIERGRVEPRLTVMLILCEGLGLTPSQLLSGLNAPAIRRDRA